MTERDYDMDSNYRIGEVSDLTGVKAGTIRFYEKCGFLEPVVRLHNQYRVFNDHHIYQIRICRLVFCEYVNKKLRKSSLRLIYAARDWNLKEYEKMVCDYRQAIEDDISGTEAAIQIAMKQAGIQTNGELQYSKKQASEIVGVTKEAIRNWERNGLLPVMQSYQRRYYSQDSLNRMLVIRLLLDTGYSIMAIKRFWESYDLGEKDHARRILTNPIGNEELLYRADQYLQKLKGLRENAKLLTDIMQEMKAV